MVQTSSPPFPILQSLDDARAWMDRHGESALSYLKEMLHDFRLNLRLLPGYRDVLTDDPTRLLIDARQRGLSGIQAQALLSKRMIDAEMADDEVVVMICTVCDTEQAFHRLHDALKSLPIRPPLPEARDAPPLPGSRAMSLRKAALAQQEAVPLPRAAGRVASVSAGRYPPGIPVLLPGETVTEECLAYLENLPLTYRFGMDKNCLICVK